MPPTHCFAAPTPLPPSPSLRSRTIRHHQHARPPTATATQPTSKTLHLTSRRPVHPSALSSALTTYTAHNAAVHSGVCAHALGRQASDALHAARSTLATSLSASSPHEIAFPGALPRASWLLAEALCARMRPRDEVVLAAAEPDHVALAWRAHAARAGVKLRRAGHPDAALGFADIAPLLSPRTRAVVVQAVTPFGARNNLHDLAELAEGAAVPFVVDLSGLLPFGEAHVGRLGCAFAVADGSAVGAFPGSAFLYGREELLAELPPLFGGEDVLAEVTFDGEGDRDERNWGPMPGRLEMGMTSVASATALAAGVRDCGATLGDDYGADLGRTLFAALDDVPGVRLLGREAEERVPVACFVLGKSESVDVAAALARRGIVAEVGFHGAVVAHTEELGVGESLRVVMDPSVHDHDDVSMLVDALKDSMAELER